MTLLPTRSNKEIIVDALLINRLIVFLGIRTSSYYIDWSGLPGL